MRLAVLAASAGMAMLGAVPASAAGADKLYVLDCGHMSAADQSRWSPGVNVGVPIELSDNCYLIHDPQGWFLWDTGLPDALAATPEGTTSANGALHVKRPKTLAGQLDERGVKPADIRAIRSRTPILTISAMSSCSRRSCSMFRRPNTNGRAPTGRRASIPITR